MCTLPMAGQRCIPHTAPDVPSGKALNTSDVAACRSVSRARHDLPPVTTSRAAVSGAWLESWAWYAVVHAWHGGGDRAAWLETLGSRYPGHARCEAVRRQRMADPIAMSPADLQPVSQDSRAEALKQLHAATAEIERTAADVQAAMQTMTSALPAIVERCAGATAVREAVLHAVIAAQLEDVAGQGLRHVVLRLRSVEAMVDGLALLAAALLDAANAVRPDTVNLAGAATRLREAIAEAQALCPPCASSSTGGGSVELF
jgi:hypothetical protein